MHTVTAGIISAVGRSSVNLADYEDFIQTDASINPGNSGGALSDLEGNVIAINTAIYSPGGTEGNIGIGFAIPVNMAKKVMHALIDKGKVARGYVGLYLQDLDDNLAKAMNLKSTNGALVAEVTPAGPADNSGVKQGDVVFNYDGKEIENTTQLRNKVAESTPGTRATFGILRGGKSLELTVVLGERPKDLASGETSAETPKENTSMKLGLAVQDLTPDVAKQLGYEKDRGVVITDVVSGSPADDAGLRQGDLIKEVNRANVGNAREFAHALANVKSDESVLFLVRRGQNAFFVAIQRS
jgi:serine protease Do